MGESLGQNHERNRLSAKSYRRSILEVGEPSDSAGSGIKKNRGSAGACMHVSLFCMLILCFVDFITVFVCLCAVADNVLSK